MAEHQLRDLSRRIMNLMLEHPACSQATGIVSSCCDHLCAVARTHEANLELDALRREKEK